MERAAKVVVLLRDGGTFERQGLVGGPQVTGVGGVYLKWMVGI
jgi:hypothetical protein